MASEQETILRRMIGKHTKRVDAIRKIRTKLHTRERKLPLATGTRGQSRVKR